MTANIIVCPYCNEATEGADACTPLPTAGAWVWVHDECMAFTIVGHEFGVCSCTGFDRSRTSARELARRIRERVTQ